jgi:hypothetical protein
MNTINVNFEFDYNFEAPLRAILNKHSDITYTIETPPLYTNPLASVTSENIPTLIAILTDIENS